MPDLSFQIISAEPAKFAASPLLNFKLQIDDAGSTTVHSVALRCQIRLEPQRRSYQPHEKERLHDLFGEPARWGSTMRSTLWAHSSVIVPPFEGSTSVDLPVPCTFDFNIAVTKYFDALVDGEVPLCLLFSGTIFYQAEDGHLQATQIPWEKETNYRLPVKTWREMMDVYYPNTAWLALRKDAFDALYAYKRLHSLPTWEAAIEKLLSAVEEASPRIDTNGTRINA